MYKITPKSDLTKDQKRMFYMHADGYVPNGYKKCPSTTVPFWRLQRVMDVMYNHNPRRFKAGFIRRRERQG